MYMPCLFNGIMAFSLIVERYDFSIFDSTFLLGKNLYNNEHVAIKLVSRNLLLSAVQAFMTKYRMRYITTS